MKRTPLRRVGKRKKRTLSEWERAKRLVRAETGRHCERCGQHTNMPPHHKLPQSRGGGHERANLALLCFHCHRGAHDHSLPDWESWVITREKGAPDGSR